LEELHAILEFSGLAKGEANKLVRAVRQSVADAQLHGKWFENPVEEHDYRKDSLKLPHRMSVFATGKSVEDAHNQIRLLYRHLNAQPSYGCEIAGLYILKGENYHPVSETAAVQRA
jgi:hypothetical protein